MEKIGIKTTRIRSLTGEEVVVTNSELLRQWIRDYTRIKERWVLFNFAVSYDTPAEKLAQIPKIVEEVLEGIPNTRFDRAHLKEYGEFSFVFEAVFYVSLPSYREMLNARHAFNLELRRRFEQQGISFALPTRRVFLERGEEKRGS